MQAPPAGGEHARVPSLHLTLDSTSAAGLVEALADSISKRIGHPPTANVDEPLLDAKAVARRLNVSLRTVDTIISEGDLVPIYVRGQRRFTPEGVDAYIRRAANSRGVGR